MTDFFFRTEDIVPEEVRNYFAESMNDRKIVDQLKNRIPTVLIGSRGVGKSFVLRVAQQEMLASFNENKVFPVYLSFVKSSLINTDDPEQFKNWMLARICASIVRALQRYGLLSATPQSARVLIGSGDLPLSDPTEIEKLATVYEDSWQSSPKLPTQSVLPSVDRFKDAIEDLKEALNIERFVLLIDEAAHIFLPEHQRQFFTLFRDLRSHCLTCNAAVYPGVTYFGETFQPFHDATMYNIDRDVLEPKYIETMREIVEKQADSALLKSIVQNGQNFAVLAYAASGNPRTLLKTLSRTPRVNSSEVNEVIREYYRTDIWSEHSNLADKYTGHREIIDWGRNFIEAHLLPELKAKNDNSLASEKNTSAFFWVHRDAAPAVKQALRILSYTGIVSEQASGIKATRAEVGTRYVVNLGCLFSLEGRAVPSAFEIAKALTPKRMTEFGSKHSLFLDLQSKVSNDVGSSTSDRLKVQLSEPVNVLDLTDWQKSKLAELNLLTVGEVLSASEQKLKQAAYVGDVRARRMRNAAVAAVLEYLSG